MATLSTTALPTTARAAAASTDSAASTISPALHLLQGLYNIIAHLPPVWYYTEPIGSIMYYTYYINIMYNMVLRIVQPWSRGCLGL